MDGVTIFLLALKYRAATIQPQALKNEVAVKTKQFIGDLTILNLSFRTSFRSWSIGCQISCWSTLTSWRRGTCSSTRRGPRWKNLPARNEHSKQPRNTKQKILTSKYQQTNQHQPANQYQYQQLQKMESGASAANTNQQHLQIQYCEAWR